MQNDQGPKNITNKHQNDQNQAQYNYRLTKIKVNKPDGKQVHNYAMQEKSKHHTNVPQIHLNQKDTLPLSEPRGPFSHNPYMHKTDRVHVSELNTKLE